MASADSIAIIGMSSRFPSCTTERYAICGC